MGTETNVPCAAALRTLKMKHVSALSMTALQNWVKIFTTDTGFIQRCWAFLVISVVCSYHLRVFDIVEPRTLKCSTVSTIFIVHYQMHQRCHFSFKINFQTQPLRGWERFKTDLLKGHRVITTSRLFFICLSVRRLLCGRPNLPKMCIFYCFVQS